ncbi:MAG TPA: NAD(P)/FAD-dependent oxidoreductase, partial [Candidatus Acidoferrales bacterium]|nr:NAD(P)/FAD-dependent oxidoreductase [Candidatus Acidoferrales bacterium]
VIDLAPDREWTAPLRRPSGRRDLAAARNALRELLPQRLADRWLELHPPEDWTNRSLEAMEQEIHQWKITPAGTEGYEKAEVTAGGVDTEELSGKTMESRKVPGLFFIGEVVDVTGHLGGFNFQWAWASGFCAGQALSPAPITPATGTS